MILTLTPASALTQGSILIAPINVLMSAQLTLNTQKMIKLASAVVHLFMMTIKINVSVLMEDFTLKVNNNVSILAQSNPHIAQDKSLVYAKVLKSTMMIPIPAYALTLVSILNLVTNAMNHVQLILHIMLTNRIVFVMIQMQTTSGR